MILPIEISTIAEYQICKDRKFEPLIDYFNFYIDMKLRVYLQNELFPEQSPENDIKFYKWVFENKSKFCEETANELLEYKSIFISHILTKGAFTECRYDGRNINLLIPRIHHIWEFGTNEQKRKLKIYDKNQYIIQLLKNDYKNYFRN